MREGYFTALLFISFTLAACSGHRASVPVGTQYLETSRASLADVRALVPGLQVDLRYASSRNLTGTRLYPSAMPCLLRRSTAQKLARAQARLRREGRSLLLWDAWRPTEVQVRLTQQAGATGLFLDPKTGWSRHCSGVAVDVSLTDLSGHELPMPTAHDEAGDRAYFQYAGDDPAIRANLRALQDAMTAEGFTMLDAEWWHFDDSDWRDDPPPPISAREMDLALPFAR